MNFDILYTRINGPIPPNSLYTFLGKITKSSLQIGANSTINVYL